MPSIHETFRRYDAAIKALKGIGDQAGAIMLADVRMGYLEDYVSASHLLIALESAEQRVRASHNSEVS